MGMVKLEALGDECSEALRLVLSEMEVVADPALPAGEACGATP